MRAQLVKDLLHLESSEDRFDQNGRADRAPRNLQSVLCEVENVVPQARLEVALQLREVEVRTASLVEQAPRVAKEVHPEIEQAARHRLPVHLDVPLLEVPAPRPHQQGRDLLVEPVCLALRAGELQAPFDRVGEVGLTVDQVRPCRRVGVLEVGHEHASTRVERVDEHLGVGRPGDLHAPVAQVVRDGRDFPVRFADRFGRRQEIGRLARVDALLPFVPGAKQLEAPVAELALQPRDEIERLGAQNLAAAGGGGSFDLDLFGGGHYRANIQIRALG